MLDLKLYVEVIILFTVKIIFVFLFNRSTTHHICFN